MAKKGRKFETRTLLIIVFVLLVIVAAYIVITNLPPEENFLTPEEILNNKDLYLDGDIITVQGYYIIVGGKEYVVSTLDVSTDGRSTLNLDTTAIN